LDLYTNSKQRLSVTNSGLVGIGTTAPANQLDVHSQSSSAFAINAVGFTAATGSGLTGNDGIDAFGGNGDPNGSTLDSYGGYGVYGQAGSGPGGDGIGGDFFGGCCVGGGGDGIYVSAGSGLAGYFSGNIQVTGAITAGTKDFKIDHPLDPANKYLVHASVESSEMKNIYDGFVTTDAQGEATVQLPEWFEVLNTDFRYQLTVIGQFAQAIVARGIENHQFSIRTSVPNVKVSWQVTGVRQDPYAKAHPLVVEEPKVGREQGHYLHPELFGAGEEQSISEARHPEIMRRMKEGRAKQKAAVQQTPGDFKNRRNIAKETQ